MEAFHSWLESLAILDILNTLASVGIVIAVGSFIINQDDRHEQDVFAAWQTISSAAGQSGSGGRKEAIEFLHSRPWRFPWFCRKGAEDLSCIIRQPAQSLAGLDVGLDEEENAKFPGMGAFLAELQLPNADLRVANLQSANLEEANLRSTNLRRANLRKADLLGANLQNADLMRVNFEGALLQEANLSNANLQEAILQAGLSSANLSSADLQNANLTSADLRGANLYKANLQWAFLSGASLGSANLSNADLREARLYGTDLRETNLQEADLWNAELPNAFLQEADLWKAHLRKAYLPGANLLEANLRDTDLRQAFLQNANLRVANLQNARLGDSNLQSANLWLANLQDADISGGKYTTEETSRRECIRIYRQSHPNITDQSLELALQGGSVHPCPTIWDRAVYDDSTHFPDGLQENEDAIKAAGLIHIDSLSEEELNRYSWYRKYESEPRQ
ncbi:MAG: pentapeptide repeat-containing protein [Synechococcus sp.]